MRRWDERRQTGNYERNLDAINRLAALAIDKDIEITQPAPTLCRPKIGFLHVTCVISDVRRLARIR
jgi:hypothetical protein